MINSEYSEYREYKNELRLKLFYYLDMKKQDEFEKL